MSKADDIRNFILSNYIARARRAGQKTVTIRAGDVHRDMRLVSRMPAVCSVLDGAKLSMQGGLTVINRHGPVNGANVFVTYGLGESSRMTIAPAAQVKPLVPARQRALDKPRVGDSTRQVLSIDPAKSIVLVSCVKSKLGHAATAQTLYTSTLFEGFRKFAFNSRAPWYVLSAKYGLVHPEEVIAPYEYTLNRLGVAIRRAWADDVLEKLLPLLEGRETVVFLAGQRYREFLVGPLLRDGLQVEIPMEGLSFGEQLQWLAEHT